MTDKLKQNIDLKFCEDCNKLVTYKDYNKEKNVYYCENCGQFIHEKENTIGQGESMDNQRIIDEVLEQVDNRRERELERHRKYKTRVTCDSVYSGD